MFHELKALDFQVLYCYNNISLESVFQKLWLIAYTWIVLISCNNYLIFLSLLLWKCVILRRKAVTVHKDLSTCSFAFLVYKAQFPKTIAEEKTEEPYVKKMIGMLSILMAVSVGLFAFLKKYGKCTLSNLLGYWLCIFICHWDE